MRRGLPSSSPKQRKRPLSAGPFLFAKRLVARPLRPLRGVWRERDCLRLSPAARRLSLRPLGWLWFGTELLRFRDGLRPAAAVGWTRGEVCGRPVQLHGLRLHRRTLVRQVSRLLGVRDARRGGRRTGRALPGSAEALAPARR